MATNVQIIPGKTTGNTSSARYCPLNAGVTNQATESLAAGIISASGILRNLRVEVSAAPGSGGSGKKWDFTIYKNGSPTAATLTIFETDTTNVYTGELSVTQGDYISLEIKPTNTPAAAETTWSCEYVSTLNNTLLMSATGGAALVDNSFLQLIGSSSGSSTEFNNEIIVPCSGTIRNLFVRTNVAPSSGKSVIITVRKNNVSQSVAVTLTESATSGSDTSNSFTVNAGDSICVQKTGGSTNNHQLNIGLTFIPDIIGNFFVAYFNLANTLNSVSAIYHPINWGGNWNATEANVDQIFSECTIKNLYVELNGTPTANQTFTLRKNASSQSLAVTIDTLNTKGNASSDVTINDNDKLDTLKGATASQSIKAKISYTGYRVDVSTEQETITSDIHFTHLQEKINSNIYFKAEELQEQITSDVEFSHPNAKINSNIHFKVEGLQEQIISDVEFVYRKSEIITSDVYFITEYDSKLIHDNHLFIITDTDPAQIIKIDLTIPTNYTKYTITGKTNGKDLFLNHDREFAYVSLAGGYVAKIDLDDPSIQTIFDVGESEQLYSITHNLTYLTTFIADGREDESLFVLDEATYEKINTDFRTRKEEQNFFQTIFNTLFGVKINTDFRTRKETESKINTDLRFIKDEYNEIPLSPIARTDFHVEIDDVELTDNDLKLDSIRITHTIDNKDTAEFTLTRKHDDINNPTTITNNNGVKIYLGAKLEFTGKIQQIDCNSESETVHVSCESDTTNEDYNIITKDLPLTSLNEQLHLYDILVNSINIDKPSIDTRLIIVSGEGLYWTGSSWNKKIDNVLIFNTFASAQNYLKANKNDNFINGNPVVDNYERNPKYYKGIKIDLGTEIKQMIIIWYGYRESQSLAEEIEEGTFKFVPNYTYFWKVDITWFDLTGKYVPSGWRYIGTSLAPLSSDLYEIKRINYRQQRIFADIENKLDYYTIGEAPFKDVSVKNGRKITRPKWVDREDGLYYEQDAMYDYEQYCKNIASVEYERIKNINGDLGLITTSNIDLTIDGYLFYTLKLLTRINIVNTINDSNIYKNTNGFPLSIKQITIDSSTMKVNINCDNQKSNWELERLYSYPEEPLEYGEFSYKTNTKFDLSNWEEIDE